jgi:hypothetical protein
MIPAELHINSRLSNITSHWSDFDNKDLFNKNMSYKSKSDLLQKLGWDHPDKITYQYNSHGFRTPEFDNKKAGLALGCSFTEGIGLPIESVWVSVLSALLNFPIWNLGVGGSSTDSCFRLLDHYLNYLNIEFVVACIPYKKRFEFFDGDGLQFIMPEKKDPEYAMPYYKNWVVADKNANINQRKNLLAMQKLCDDKKIKLVYLHFSDFEMLDLARDLNHYGIESNKNFAQKVLKQL